MQRISKLFPAFVFTFAFFSPPAPAQGSSNQPTRSRELLEYVRGIEGRDHEGRKQFILDELQELGVPFILMPFDTALRRDTSMRPIQGVNIIVRLGKGNNGIVVGAHYDAVPGSPGANDNGGGVAVVLELINALSNVRLNHLFDFCFFDQEEAGLIGSRVYVRQRDTTVKHLAMINLDVEGVGDEVFIGPVGGGDDSLLMHYARRAHEITGYSYREEDAYPGSDYHSFAERKLENISISIVPKGDSEKLANAVRSNFNFSDTTKIPFVLKTMHSPEDKSTHMSEKSLNMSYEFTRTLLLLLNDHTR